MADARSLAIEETGAAWRVTYRRRSTAAPDNRSEASRIEVRPASAHDGPELQAAIVLALQTVGGGGPNALATQIAELTVAATDADFTTLQRRKGRIEYSRGGEFSVVSLVTESDGADRVTGEYERRNASTVSEALSFMVADMGHAAFAAQIAGL